MFPATFPACCAELCSQQSPDLLIAIIRWMGLQPHKPGQPRKSKARLRCWWQPCPCPPEHGSPRVLGIQMRGKVNEPNCLHTLKMHVLITPPPPQLVFFLQRTNKTLASSFTTRFFWVDTGLGDLQWHSESQKWEVTLSGDQWRGQKLTWQLPRCFAHSSVFLRMTANFYSHCIKWTNGKNHKIMTAGGTAPGSSSFVSCDPILGTYTQAEYFFCILKYKSLNAERCLLLTNYFGLLLLLY